MEGTIVNEGWVDDDDGVVAVATNMEKESKVANAFFPSIHISLNFTTLHHCR